MLPRRLACLLGLAALLASLSTRAAEPNVEARQLYAEGKAEYAQGHYPQAIALFERSYALSESPALLFNMAQAHRLAGPTHCRAALSLYKSYLAAEPHVENRKEVEERIQELASCPAEGAQETPVNAAPAVSIGGPRLDVPPRPPTPAPARTAVLPPRRSPLPTGPVLVTGTGAALLVAGGVLYWRAWEKHREAEQRCPCYPGTYASWEVLSNVSYALLAVGGATLAGGVTWWAVGQPSRNGQPAQAMLGVAGKF
jgi:tetratricopeptide (TPR) repeat protein